MHADSMLASKIVKGTRMTNIQIRGVPVALREKVRRRANRRGQTMSQYLIDLVRNDADQMSMEEFLAKVRRWKPLPHRMSGAQAVREARRIEEGLEP